MARSFRYDPEDDYRERRQRDRNKRDARKTQAQYLTPPPVTRTLRDASPRNSS